MRPTKSNHGTKYGLAFVFLLLMACLILTVGVSFARYQYLGDPQVFGYQAKQYSSVYLGSAFDGKTLDTTQSTWNYEENGYSMSCVVSNGSSNTSFAQEDQWVTFYLTGTLGFSAEEEPMDVSILVRKDNGDGTAEVKTCQGIAQPIQPQTPLYARFGEGWFFTFQNILSEKEEEARFLLEGGEFSMLSVTLYVQGKAMDASMLEFQVSSSLSDQ